MFREAGLNITIEANMNTVDFLDITLNLDTDMYELYTKPNNVIQYVNANSNHPKNVLDNIPVGIEKRVNELSKNEFLFNKHKDTYQEALGRAGYSYKIKYIQKSEENNNKKKNRQRKVIYFNPPFSKSVETNIGQKFLKLVKKCFHKGHPFRKIFNKNTIKVTYSCLPNMGVRIAGQNKQKINSDVETENIGKCTCKKSYVHLMVNVKPKIPFMKLSLLTAKIINLSILLKVRQNS